MGAPGCAVTLQERSNSQLQDALFCTLVDPGANEGDLFRGEGFGRRTETARTTWSAETARRWAACVRTTGSAISYARRRSACSWTSPPRASRPPWATATGPAFGWHSRFVIDLGRGDDQRAFLAVADHNDFSVFATFQETFEGVETQISLGSLLSVAPKA